MLASLLTASLVSLALQAPLAAAGPVHTSSHFRRGPDALPESGRKDPVSKNADGTLNSNKNTQWEAAVDDKQLFALFDKDHQSPNTFDEWKSKMASFPISRGDWSARDTSPQGYEKRNAHDNEWPEPTWKQPVKLENAKEACMPCGSDFSHVNAWQAAASQEPPTTDGKEWPTRVGDLTLCVCTTNKLDVDWKADKGTAFFEKLNRMPTPMRQKIKTVVFTDKQDAKDDYFVQWNAGDAGQFSNAMANTWLNSLGIYDDYLGDFKKIISTTSEFGNKCLPTPDGLKSHRAALRELVMVYFNYWYAVDPKPAANAGDNISRAHVWSKNNLGCLWPAVFETMKRIQTKYDVYGLPLPAVDKLFPLVLTINVPNPKGKNYPSSAKVTLQNMPCAEHEVKVKKEASCADGEKPSKHVRVQSIISPLRKDAYALLPPGEKFLKICYAEEKSFHIPKQAVSVTSYTDTLVAMH
ncbi:hypothetical protein CXG81DRAFT_19268, partial [Caulochytrium protostelioides]